MISFKQRHFKNDVILMLVRWYVAYPMSYRVAEKSAHPINKDLGLNGLSNYVLEEE